MQRTSLISNNRIKLSEASGLVLEIELKMRILVEQNSQLQNAVKNLTKEPIYKCRLIFIDKAIPKVFFKELTEYEKNILKTFREKRNKFIHADFVELMKKLNIRPSSR